MLIAPPLLLGRDHCSFVYRVGHRTLYASPRRESEADREFRVRRLIREAAAKQVGAVDPVGFGDCRYSSVPEYRVQVKPMHHQHRRRTDPRPQEIVTVQWTLAPSSA